VRRGPENATDLPDELAKRPGKSPRHSGAMRRPNAGLPEFGYVVLSKSATADLDGPWSPLHR
jgi:hypothetical protein